MANASIVQESTIGVGNTQVTVYHLSLTGVTAAHPLLLQHNGTTQVLGATPITDTGGHTWTKVQGAHQVGADVEVWIGTGGTGGSITVTVTGTADYMGGNLFELNAKATAPIATSNINQTTGTTPAGTGLTATSTELVIFCMGSQGIISANPASPWVVYKHPVDPTTATAQYGATASQAGTGSSLSPSWTQVGGGWVVIGLIIAPPGSLAAPTVTTEKGLSYGGTIEVLSALVTPNGASTTVHFQYGATTSYGSTTGTVNIGSGSAVLVQIPVTGLTAGNTYHFRAVASNSVGTTNGSDATFTTRLGVPLSGVLGQGAVGSGPLGYKSSGGSLPPVVFKGGWSATNWDTNWKLAKFTVAHGGGGTPTYTLLPTYPTVNTVSSTQTITCAAVGNLVACIVHLEPSSGTSAVTSMSDTNSRITWTGTAVEIGHQATLSNNRMEVWMGKVASTGTTKIETHWSGTTFDEFIYVWQWASSKGAAATWSKVNGGIRSAVASGTTMLFPAVTSAASGSAGIYMGWIYTSTVTGTAGSAGSTPGFSYKTDSFLNLLTWNSSLATSTAYTPNGVQTPINENYNGIAVIIKAS